MAKCIEVIVQPTGELKIDAVGFAGAECEKATRFLENALGEVNMRQNKPEYHCRARTSNKQKVGH